MGSILHAQRIEYAEVDLTWMVGRTITVDLPNPPLPWFFALGDGAHITVECPWRILQGRRVRCSSEDHDQQYGLPAPIDATDRATELLSDHPIKGVELREGSADLVLDFGHGLTLEIIPFSSGYESWQIIEPSGTWLVAQGGGGLSRCKLPT